MPDRCARARTISTRRHGRKRARYAARVSRLALSLAVLLAVAAVAVPTGAAGVSRAKVRVVTLSPLVIRGTGFKAHERVRVTATPGGVRRVVSRANGTFRAVFAGSVDRCVGLTVRAAGARGDEAALKLPQPACPPQD